MDSYRRASYFAFELIGEVMSQNLKRLTPNHKARGQTAIPKFPWLGLGTFIPNDCVNSTITTEKVPGQNVAALVSSNGHPTYYIFVTNKVDEEVRLRVWINDIENLDKWSYSYISAASSVTDKLGARSQTGDIVKQNVILDQSPRMIQPYSFGYIKIEK